MIYYLVGARQWACFGTMLQKLGSTSQMLLLTRWALFDLTSFRVYRCACIIIIIFVVVIIIILNLFFIYF